MSSQHPIPPKWTTMLLKRLCKAELLEEIEGDLLEYYHYWVNEHGEKKANRLYLFHAIKFLRPFALKSIVPLSIINPYVMFKNHLKISWRNLLRNRGYSSINILGLVLGFTSSLLIYLWISSEISKDHQHTDSERIYGVYSRAVYDGGINAQRNTPAKLPAELLKSIPEIEYATGYASSFRLSLKGVTRETFQVGENVLKMSGTRGSPDFFNIFSFQLLEGNADVALKDLHSISISRKMADVFFGSPEKAIGQTIRYQNERDLVVTAVFEDIDSQSSLQFDYLINWDAWVNTDPIKQAWGHFGTQTYIKLKEGADISETEEKIKHVLSHYLDFDDSYRVELGLQKFEDQYLYGNFSNGKPTGGRIAYVRAFRGVALFILIIAIINFINLTTATASKRSKEIGIRKVVGATRFTLKSQFIVESTLLTFIGICLSIVLVTLLLPAFNSITLKAIVFPYSDFRFWLQMIMLTLVIGIIAGGYPAFVLSRIRLIPALKNVSRNNSGPGFIRKGLVTFQFSLSILLIVATLVVSRQTHFIRNKQLGFDKENLIYIPLEGKLLTEYSLFRSEASKMPGILSVDRSSQTPHDMGFSGPFLDWEGKEPNDQTPFTPSSVGFDFVQTMQLEVVKGRGFDRSRSVDATNFIINETAEGALGVDDVIGKTVSIFGKEGKIVGVIKDFHYSSLHQPIRPLVLDVKEDLNFGTGLVRIEDGKTDLALKNLEEVCRSINPGYAFSYTFVDDTYDEMYKVESTMSVLTQYFASLAILISCLGLFALVAFAAEQKVKEIGIRKVLGATIMNIFHLLSNEFIFLLIVSMAIAAPLGYFLMNEWLNEFAYRIQLGWWLFGLAFLATVFISYLVIGSHVLRSVRANPVNSLRDE